MILFKKSFLDKVQRLTTIYISQKKITSYAQNVDVVTLDSAQRQCNRLYEHSNLPTNKPVLSIFDNLFGFLPIENQQ